MLGISDRAVAYFVDRSVFYFGSSLEADIEEAEKGRKTAGAKQLARTVRMNSWLGISQYRSV
jgi:hypothetical protein